MRDQSQAMGGGSRASVRSVAFVLGTRPEAIKLAPVVLRCRESLSLGCSVLCTGQHREMVDQALRMFDLIPDADLNLMKQGQDLASLTAAVIMGVDGFLKKWKPDMLVVQGDTTTAFSAAHVGFYHQIKVAHVEAGLRTWNRAAPFPEETNRVFISQLSDLHFAPTEGARGNLLKEGIDERRIYVTGNTVVDALNIVFPEVARTRPEIPDIPDKVPMRETPTVLITGHRRESFGHGLFQICSAIRKLSEDFPDVSFVYPVHLNPRVRDTVFSCLGEIRNVHLIRPLDYRELLYLMSLSDLIISDSGGIQEEAPSFGAPVLVTRECTERLEGLATGAAILVGCDAGRIVGEASRLLKECRSDSKGAQHPNPYGDGRAAERIVRVLEDHLA